MEEDRSKNSGSLDDEGSFLAYLEWASQEVSKWPRWKRVLLGWTKEEMEKAGVMRDPNGSGFLVPDPNNPKPFPPDMERG
jgi:hypothetical protein